MLKNYGIEVRAVVAQRELLKEISTKEVNKVDIESHIDCGGYIARSYGFSAAAQHQNPDKEAVKSLNNVIEKFIESPDFGINFVPLDATTLSVGVSVYRCKFCQQL